MSFMLPHCFVIACPPEGGGALIESPEGVLAILLATLATVLGIATHPTAGRVFKVVPALVFCYFVPTTLSTLGVIPSDSALYQWVRQFVLPASLVLLTLSLDLKGIVRLGPKAGVMMLAGTTGVMIGGPISLLIWQHQLPPDAWRTMSYLCGSWIGGSANGAALQKTFGATDAAIAPLIVVDAVLAYTWMGLLLILAGRAGRIDRRLGADASALAALERRMRDYPVHPARIPSLADLMMILAFGFGLAWAAHAAGLRLVNVPLLAALRDRGVLDAYGWKIILVTAAGVLASLTRARSLEGAGASKIGALMIYLLVACIGAGADFKRLSEDGSGYFFALGATWMLVHAAVVLLMARLTRAPLFFAAVASQANIGGVASAPVVAGAFNPALAPVGVLLGVLGYALGTYGGWMSVQACRAVAGGG